MFINFFQYEIVLRTSPYPDLRSLVSGIPAPAVQLAPNLALTPILSSGISGFDSLSGLQPLPAVPVPTAVALTRSLSASCAQILQPPDIHPVNSANPGTLGSAPTNVVPLLQPAKLVRLDTFEENPGAVLTNQESISSSVPSPGLVGAISWAVIISKKLFFIFLC